jgi:ACR3 family arsenite transporter
MEVAKVNLPVAVLIWAMIYPMMVQVDFKSILGVRRHPKGLTVTLVVNWLIKPFTMFGFAWLFLKGIFGPFIEPGLASEYVAGAILLGAAPCTAMVFVWSYLTDGDPAYTLVQVSINDLIMLVAFAPIVAFLLGLSDVIVPWDTLLLSVGLYIVIPLAAGALSRMWIIQAKGEEWFDTVFLERLGPVTMGGLLLTLVLRGDSADPPPHRYDRGAADRADVRRLRDRLRLGLRLAGAARGGRPRRHDWGQQFL